MAEYDQISLKKEKERKNTRRALVFKVGYYPRKKSRNLIVVFHPGVFQDHVHASRTCVHHLGVQRLAKLEIGCVFGQVVDKFWKGHDRQIKKKNAKNAHFRFYFHAWKIRAYRVSSAFYTRMIPSLNTSAPRLLKSTLFQFWTKIEFYYKSSYSIAPYNKFFIQI